MRMRVKGLWAMLRNHMRETVEKEKEKDRKVAEAIAREEVSGWFAW
jgi:hypothetical protein